MNDATLIFPDQLFQNHPGIASGRMICLAEEFLFYKVQPFHKQRLTLLRAVMRAYLKKLRKEQREVLYIPIKAGIAPLSVRRPTEKAAVVTYSMKEAGSFDYVVTKKTECLVRNTRKKGKISWADCLLLKCKAA